MSSSTCPIENVVVVMLENRSYDNVLGWLYNSGNAPPFNQAPKGQQGLDGLNGTETNPSPNNGPTVTVSAAAATTINGNLFRPPPSPPSTLVKISGIWSSNSPAQAPFPQKTPTRMGSHPAMQWMALYIITN